MRNYLGSPQRARYLHDIAQLRNRHTLERLEIQRQVRDNHQLYWRIEIQTLADDPHDGVCTIAYEGEWLTTADLHELIDNIDHSEWIAG